MYQTAEFPTTLLKRKSLLTLFNGLSLIVGLLLLFSLLYFVGYHTILDSLTQVGWGFIPIIILNVGRHIFRSYSMYLAVPPQHRNFKFRQVIAARFGGEAISFISFTGPFLGDATKAMLLKKDIPITYGAAAVLKDNLVYYTTVILMIMAGSIFYLYSFSSPVFLSIWPAILCASVLCAGCIILAISFRITPFSSLITKLRKFKLAPRFILKSQETILKVETDAVHFYHHRRTDFFTLFGINTLVHFLSVCEVYIALEFLGFDSFWSNAFIIESLTKIVNVIFGFVPGMVGVYEGGTGIIMKSLGSTAAVGIALALVRRGAMIVSFFAGTGVLLWRALNRGTESLAHSRGSVL